MSIFMQKFNYINRNYKKFHLFFTNEKELNLLEKIINKEYGVIKEYKNDKRTYVAKIEIDNKFYILKRPYQRNLLKKIIGIFKKCESLTVFKNVRQLRNENVDELVNILGGGIKRSLFIEEEFYIMDYVDGKIYLEDEKYIKIMETVKKIHQKGRYHGDCNPYNFLFDKDKIYIIDTKLKKMVFGNYRAHYDILTLMKYLKRKMDYPYNKNIFYYVALFFRKQRN